MVAKRKMSIEHLRVWKLYEKIMLLTKYHYVRSLQCAKKHDYRNLAHRPTLWVFQDHCVKDYDILHKIGKGILCEAEQWPKIETDWPGLTNIEEDNVWKCKTTLLQVTTKMDMEFWRWQSISELATKDSAVLHFRATISFKAHLSWLANSVFHPLFCVTEDSFLSFV